MAEPPDTTQHPSTAGASAPAASVNRPETGLSGSVSDEQGDPQGFGYVPVPAGFLTLLADAVGVQDATAEVRLARIDGAMRVLGL